MTARRSPSRVMAAPVVVLIIRMLGPEASDGAWLVGMYLDEVLGARHGQHGLHALLDARELQLSARAAHLAVQIHQAADRGAVHIGDRRQVDDDVARAARDERGHGRGEIRENRIHQPRLADADHGDGSGLFGCQVHQCTPVMPLGLKCWPRSFRICRASSLRPRLIRDFTVPSGSRKAWAISWYESSWRSRIRTAVRSVFGSDASASRSSSTRSRCSRTAIWLCPGAEADSSAVSTSRSMVSRSFRTLR